MKRKFLFIWQHLKGAKLFAGAVIIATAGFVFASLLRPLFTGFMIDHVINNLPLEDHLLGPLMLKIFGSQDQLRHNLVGLVLVFIGLNALGSLAQLVRGYANGKVSETVSRSLRNQFYRHLQALPYGFFQHHQTGDLIQRATSDIDLVRRFLAMQMSEFYWAIFNMVITISIMLSIHVPLTLVAISLMPFLGFYAFSFFKRMRKDFLAYDEAEGQLSAVLSESIDGIRVIKAFNQERAMMDRFHETNKDFHHKGSLLAKLNARYWGLSDLLVYSQIYLTLLAGMVFTLKGWISVGDLVVFSSYSVFILWPARQLGRLIADMGRVSVALDRIFEILDEDVEDLHTGLVPAIKGHIQFKNVSFAYEEGEPLILDKVSFEVKPGEKVAIMGPTGSGKSSLVVLLARLYDSYQGQILVDGVDIQTIQKDYLRKRLGIVLQEPFLYSRSLFENIKLANPEAKMDQVREAAQVAQIDSVIQSFDQGYDTLVGEKGVTLSGGQKQRVAIARVVINQPPILIFDDSLSAVDSQTDYDIRHALANHVSGQTLLLITSRTNTAMGMDKILVMDQGKIVQVGTHDELSGQPGLYQELYQLQHRMDQGGLLNG